MRILHMIPPEANNGVSQYIFNHMPYVDLEKYPFSFLTRAVEALMDTPEYRKYKFPIYRISTTDREDKDVFERSIREILSDKIDVIHLHTSSWRGFLIEKIAMDMGIKKVIVHSHSTGIDIGNNDDRKERLRIHNRLRQEFSMKYATDLCACSKVAADWLFGEHIPRDKISILHNAIDTKKFRYDARKRQLMRNMLGLESKHIIGHVGRYSYSKNQDFLIRVFAEACKSDTDLFLLLMGQGEDKEQLQKLADNLQITDKVRFFGWQENVADYLQAMDIFCLPSRFEGAPISVIEAQAAGLPCFISDRVTDEVRVTKLIKFLPLDRKVWVEAILENVTKERAGYDIEVKDSGFDISDAAAQLEMLYSR